MSYGRFSEAPLPPIDGTRKAHRELRARVFIRDDFTCLDCGAKADPRPEGYDGRYAVYGLTAGCNLPANYLQIDHIIPRSKGGTHDEGNLQTLCYSCNSRKGARDPIAWKKLA